MRVRSSSKCSRKLIEVMGSRSDSCGSSSATASGMATVGGRIYVRRRRIRVRPILGQSKSRRGSRDGSRHWLDLGRTRLRLLFPFLLELQLRNFRLDLGLELVRCALKLGESFPDLTSDLRQLFWPE